MFKRTKKAFTIVELVIVIAVIAILAAVLIPTFANLIKSANRSADEQSVYQMNQALAIDEAENGVQSNVAVMIFHMDEEGYHFSNYHPLTTGYDFFWCKATNRIVLIDVSGESAPVIVYPAETVAEIDYSDLLLSAERAGSKPGASYFSLSSVFTEGSAMDYPLRVSTLDEMKAAFAGETEGIMYIELSEDINMNEPDHPVVESFTISGDGAVVNLNGHHISGYDCAAFDVKAPVFELCGSGSVSIVSSYTQGQTGGNAAPVIYVESDCNLAIGAGVTLNATEDNGADSYGIYIYHGLEVSVNGDFTIDSKATGTAKGDGIGIYIGCGSVVEINGDPKINASTIAGNANGIYVDSSEWYYSGQTASKYGAAELTINGNPKINVTSAASMGSGIYSMGIQAWGSVVLNGAPVISVTCANGSDAYAVYVGNGNLTVTGAAELKAYSSKECAVGIYFEMHNSMNSSVSVAQKTKMEIIGDLSVSVVADDVESESYYAVGIYARDDAGRSQTIDVTITGNVTVEGGNSLAFFYGVTAQVENGNYSAGEGCDLVSVDEGAELTVTGGIFSSDVSQYCPTGYVSVQGTDGKYVVSEQS